MDWELKVDSKVNKLEGNLKEHFERARRKDVRNEENYVILDERFHKRGNGSYGRSVKGWKMHQDLLVITIWSYPF